MDSVFFLTRYCIILMSILFTQIDTQTTISDLANITAIVIENITSILVGNDSDLSKGTGGEAQYPNGEQLGTAIAVGTTKLIKKRTTPGPEDTNLPYTLVFYDGRRRRRMYPQMSGYVIYRRKPFHREYLLFETTEKPYHWTPPKADVEPGETHLERALKELENDSGLTVDDIIDVPMDKSNFRQYMLNRKGGKFFVARIIEPNKEISICSKYIRYKWLGVQDAMAITDDLGHLMIKKTENYLEKNGY